MELAWALDSRHDGRTMGIEPDAESLATAGILGRLGSWHSYRWLSPLFGLVFFLAAPWPRVAPWMLDELIVLNVVVGLAWGVPAWRMGVVVTNRGVRFTGVLLTQRFRWDEIDTACIARIGIEPRLRLTLVDGEEAWAPGFRIPYQQADSRADGWRSTEMYRAAQLITAEAERRRQEQPPNGTLVPLPLSSGGAVRAAA